MSTATRGDTSLQTVVPQSFRGVDRANVEATFAQARKLLTAAIGIDSHIDTIQRVLVMGEDLGKRHDVGHVDIPRLREGGMQAPFFAFWVSVSKRGGRTQDAASPGCQAIGAGSHKDQIELATTAADLSVAG